MEQQEREGPSGDEDHDGAAVLRVGAEEHAGAEPGKGLKAGLRRLYCRSVVAQLEERPSKGPRSRCNSFDVSSNLAVA